MDSILTWLFLGWGLMMIYFSSAEVLSKFVYVITLFSMVGFAMCQEMFSAMSILSVIAIGSLFLLMEYESILAAIIILVVLTSIYTMGLYISPQNMLIIISILLIALYSTLFGFVIATKNDPFLMAYYFTFMFLIWNCITNVWQPPPRLV